MSQSTIISKRYLAITPVLFLTGAVWAQIGAKPICNYAIETTYTRSNEGTDCSSYTICVDGYNCVEGSDYETCGTPASDFPRRCETYIGGTWNQTTGQCEGGFLQMPYYFDGFVNGYDNWIQCQGGTH